MANWRVIGRILLKAAILFVILNVLFAWLQPLPALHACLADPDAFRSGGDRVREGGSYMLRSILRARILCVLVAFFGNPVTQFTVVFGEGVYDAGPTVVGSPRLGA